MADFVPQPTILRSHPKFVATQVGDIVKITGATARGFGEGMTIEEIAANPAHALYNQLPGLRAVGAVAAAFAVVDDKAATIAFTAEQWALGAGERARFAAFDAARSARQAASQKAERAFDRLNNEGGEGYNPYRAGSVPTYGRR